MQIAHIYPIKNLDYMKKQKYNMLLTHLALKYPEYRAIGKELSECSYTILDNSLIECGCEAIDISTVCDMAELMEVDEIILPDVFRNGCATIASAMASLEYLKHRYDRIPFRLMAVAQGNTVENFEKCFDFFNKCEAIDTIGIPKICSRLHPKGRPYFESLWLSTTKDIHLLGLYYSFTELREYKYPYLIRSVDTCHKSFLIKEGLKWNSTRPDGFTVDLINDYIPTNKLKGMKKLECLVR